MNSYTAASIRVHTWPDLERLPDGRSQRTWHIQLAGASPEQPHLEEYASRITQMIADHIGHDPRVPTLRGDLIVTLCRLGPKGIQATMSTWRDGNAEELLPAAWQMFEQIDQKIGPITTIEGQPRDNWPPWNLRQYATNGH